MIGFRLLILLLGFLAFAMSVPTVLAVGIGIKPAFIDVELEVGQEKNIEVSITNISDEPSFYQIYPDSFQDEILVSPFEFYLNPNENKLIQVIITGKGSGKKSTNLSVVARPIMSAKFTAGAGVKIPINFIITHPLLKEKNFLYWGIFAVLIIICIFLLFRLRLKRKNKNQE